MEKIMIGRKQKSTLLRCTKAAEGSVMEGDYALCLIERAFVGASVV
jgi:hypothetical protein